MATSSHVTDTAARLQEDEHGKREIASKVDASVTSGHATMNLTETSDQSNTIAANNEYERKAYIIGICGGSASGKTTVARNIIQDLHIMGPPKACVLISMDSFYRDFNEQERELAFKHEFNFDTPGAFDFALLKELLRKMKDKQPVEIPQYSFVKHAREKGVVTHVEPAEIVLFEGILAFHDPEVAALCDLKIFVDIDPDIRLARRLQRDIVERGRDLSGALKQYERSVKPSFDQYIAPTKSMADIIVPRGGENHIAIDIIIGHLLTRLQESPFAMPVAKAISDDTAVASSSSSLPHLRTVSAFPMLLPSPSSRAKLLAAKSTAANMPSSSIPSDASPKQQQQALKRVADHHNHFNGNSNQHSHSDAETSRTSNGNVYHTDQIKPKELSENGKHAASTTNGFVMNFSNGFNHHYTNHQCAMDRASPTSNTLIKRTKFAGNSPSAANGALTETAAQNYHSRTVSPISHRHSLLKSDSVVSSGGAVSASSSASSFVHELVAVDSV